ncbi:hypothetical protein A2914_00920 [Candidatus Nomurabacteria bacterium RIFCSPLOWO2_01_FULL_41_21]|uniref:VOC domain-containing protein n=2 Tax=Candidatus Nomuraibacteriota TaxID=1752729 RepID=A0A1F6V227_9BACT|nr:MAG: hypothetical protein A2733_02010 [Candidatus Nomurabacteria bacterium RIFCSPHIGHO2_01_FULL_40_20]OGI87878.1 MAG: hypothetical protein A2914_00920 [Candidatus Nomurabacteria bacterium RIFCSPLOWO2_01_FULL_41_21]
MKSKINNNLIIELHIPDFGKVKEFYSKLGFEVISEDKKGKNYPGYLVLKRKDKLGDTIINFYGDDDRVFNQSYFKKFPRDTIRGYAIELTMPTSNIEDFYSMVKSNLPQYIVKELQESRDDYRVWHDFRMADPYGYYLRFTELLDWGQP